MEADAKKIFVCLKIILLVFVVEGIVLTSVTSSQNLHVVLCPLTSAVCLQLLPSSIWSPSPSLPPPFLLLHCQCHYCFHQIPSLIIVHLVFYFSLLISRFDLVFSKSWSDYLSFHRLTAH